MAFIDKKDPVVLNIKLTSKGRELLSQGNLKFKYFAIGDSEVDYNFNYETGHLSVESNILRPLDNNPNILSFITKTVSGDPYNALPNGIGSQYLVVNSTEPNGFFTNTTGNSFTFITDSNHVKQPDIMIDMSTVAGGTSLQLLKSPTYGTSGEEPAVGDVLLVKWTLNGNTTSYTTNKTNPTPFLTYQIIGKTGTLAANNLVVTVDRELPDFSAYTPTGLAGALVYKPIISFSGDTLFNYSPDYLDESVLTFLQNSQCPTVIFPFWNMSIIFTEEIAGVQTGNKTYGEFDSHEYAGFVSYIQNQAPFFKKLGVIHYTNSSPANVYAEGFYLNTPVLDVPTIMWHKSTGTTLGAKFIAGNSYTLTGLTAHYYDLVDASDPTVIVGKIFDELKLFVIEDPELLFAMSYKSNRSWTLPQPVAAAGGGCAEPVTPEYGLNTLEGIAGSIANTGGINIKSFAEVTEYGMQFKKSSDSTWSSTIRGTTLTVDSFSATIGNILGSTSYDYRAYVVYNGVNLYTGDVLTLTTLPTPVVPVAPTVTLNAIVDVTQTTAGGQSTIVATGGAPITVSGVVWSTSPNPTTSGTKSTDGTGTAGSTFTGHLIGLAAGTLYYVRAYATNNVDTAYSSELTFTSAAPAVGTPILSTAAISGIGKNTATGGGIITSDGGASVTARGVVWNTSTSPTTANSKTTDGSGTGAFVSSLTSLSPSTLYYVRAYATNSAGTAYGNEVTFTTAAAPVAPTVTTGTAGSITSTSAIISNNNVIADGGAPLFERGVVWSLSSGPTMPTSTEMFAPHWQTQLGTFNVSMEGRDSFDNPVLLSPNTTYYVRAYAGNYTPPGPDGLYGYGNQITVTTPPYVPPATSIELNIVDGGSIGTNYCKGEIVPSVPLSAGECITLQFNSSTNLAEVYPGEQGEITFTKSCNGAPFAYICTIVHSGPSYYGGGGGGGDDYFTLRPNDRICFCNYLYGGSVSSAPSSYNEFYLHISAYSGSISPFIGLPNNVCAYYS